MKSFILALLILSQSSWADDHDEEGYRFRFKTPPQQVVTTGETPHGDHGHGSMSESQLKARQQAVSDFWRQRSGPITKADVVKLYYLAEDFKVVHSLLGTTISAAESHMIGRLRQEIHDEVLRRMAHSEEFGTRMGVNDFGSGADPNKVDAKTDIDFTPYAGKQGVTGAEMVARYKQLFRQVTAEFGHAVDPGQMDIVAHRFEATIPDWRRTQSSADFTLQLRTGLSLLRTNPEAYFLQGAYLQQVMARSANPNAKTFLWFEKGKDGKWSTRQVAAATVPQFFYHPDVGARYAWGAAVGNWHFFHAHGDDTVAQAKYLLRSMDDGAGLLSKVKADEYEKLSKQERRRLLQELYGKQLNRQQLLNVEAVLETAVKMRQMKSAKTLRLGAFDGEVEAYRPLIEHERRKAGDVALDDATALRLAKESFLKSGNLLLVTNNLITSQQRLTDWLAPPLKPGQVLRGVDENGNRKRWEVDAEMIKRLQYASFFELRYGLELMDEGMIRRIQQENPRFRQDIEVLKGIIETEKKLAAAEAEKPVDGLLLRQQVSQTLKGDYDHVKKVLRQKGVRSGLWTAGQVYQVRGDQVESWLHRQAVNKIISATGGVKYVPVLETMRTDVQRANEQFVGPIWMSRMDKGTSLVEIAKAYVREGELNETVLKVAVYEGFSYVSGVGTLYAIQGGVEGISTITFVRLIPGYGQILLTGQLVKGTVELAGLMVFEPLKRDKLTLYYQGYLEPEPGGWFTFWTGQKERVESPRPALTYPVDPERTLPIEERREAMYHYFHKQIVADMQQDPDIWFTEEEFPRDWQEEEFKRVPAVIDRYVEDWWHARGVFASFDELLVHRADEDLRPKLKQLLIDDYVVGKNRAIQRMMEEYERQQKRLEALFTEIAGVDAALDEEREQLSGSYQQAGELQMASVIDSVDRTEPGIEILAAPAESQIHLRAQVYGNFEDHPTPWKIEWEVNARGAEDLDFSGEGREESEAERGPITVTARAFDAAGAVIIEKSIALEVERTGKGWPDEEELGEGEPPPEEPKGDDPDAGMTGLVDQAAAASSRVESNCQAADASATEISQQLEIAMGAVEQVQADLTELAALQEALQEELPFYGDSGSQIATLRSEVGQHTLLACEAAEQISEAEEEEDDKLLRELVQTTFQEADGARGKGDGAKQAYNRLQQSVEDYSTLIEKIEAYQELRSRIEAQMQGLATVRGSASSGLDQARSGAEAAAADYEALMSLRNRAAAQAAGSEQVEVIEGLVGSLDHCGGALSERVESAEGMLSEFEELLGELDSLPGDEAGERTGLIQSGAEEARAELDTAEVFMESIESYLEQAATCRAVAAAVELPPQDPFMVVMTNFMPDLPDPLPGDMTTEQYVGTMTVGSYSLKAGDQVVFVMVYPDAQYEYPAERFSSGKQFATPLSLTIAQSGSPPVSLSGGLLLKVAKVYTDMEAFTREYGNTTKPTGGLLVIRLQSEDGRFQEEMRQDGSAFRFNGGPFEEGWSRDAQSRNLKIFKQAVALFDCFIATEVYGPWESEKLTTLRDFRDRVMASSEAGRRLIHHYKRLGPGWAKWVSENEWSRPFVRFSVDSAVWLINTVDDSSLQWGIEWVDSWLDQKLSDQKTTSPDVDLPPLP